MTIAHWPNDDVHTIAVMGATGSGKTTFINTACDNATLKASSGLKSCTEVVQASEPFFVDGRKVMLVDTPGFDDTTKTDTDILRLIADFLVTSYNDGQRLSGVLFLHRISDFRMSGIAAKNFRLFRNVCGEASLRNVVIVSNMWGEVSLNIGETREQELATQDDFFKPVLDKGARMMRHHNTRESALDIIRYVLGNHPVTLKIQHEMVHEHKEVIQTSAAEELEKALKEELERERLEKERVQAELEAVMRRQEEEARKQREAEARRIQEELERAEAERRRIAEEMERQRIEMARKMREEEEARRREAERAQREFEERMRLLQRQQEEEARRHREEQERLQRALQEEHWRREQARRNSGGGCTIQ